VRIGVNLWSQATDWHAFADAARRIDGLGYDYLFTWDHLYAAYGDPYQPILEGWSLLAALATVTTRARIGLLTCANTFRNPGLVAKMITTIDHISGGRTILGMGGAWLASEHEAHGIPFGSRSAQRLDWLEQSVGVIRALLDGQEVSLQTDKYAFAHLRHSPRPLQERIPLIIGGMGMRKTLRTVARYADMWHAYGDLDTVRQREAVLRGYCEEIGRDHASLERTFGFTPIIRDDRRAAELQWERQVRWNKLSTTDGIDFWAGSPSTIAERIDRFRGIGFSTVIISLAPPYDMETIERFAGEVLPMLTATRDDDR